MKYKLVIFDFDGTLADSFPWLVKVINKVAEKFEFKQIKMSEHKFLRHYDAQKIFQHLGLPLWKAPLIGTHLRKLMSDEIHSISLFKGIDTMLRKLSQNQVVLAIVSSNSVENIRYVLGEELAALIQYFECGVSVFGKGIKLRKVLHKSRISSKETIYIGDEIRDIEAARHVRIASGGVSWGYNSAESLRHHSAMEIFDSVEDLSNKLLA